MQVWDVQSCGGGCGGIADRDVAEGAIGDSGESVGDFGAAGYNRGGEDGHDRARIGGAGAGGVNSEGVGPGHGVRDRHAEQHVQRLHGHARGGRGARRAHEAAAAHPERLHGARQAQSVAAAQGAAQALGRGALQPGLQ